LRLSPDTAKLQVAAESSGAGPLDASSPAAIAKTTIDPEIKYEKGNLSLDMEPAYVVDFSVVRLPFSQFSGPA